MKINFQLKILIIIFVTCISSTAIFILLTIVNISNVGKKGLLDKSQAILTKLENARNYVATQDTLTDIVKSVIQKYPNGNIPESEKLKILKSVPIYASLELGKSGSDTGKYLFLVSSSQPRNSKNLAEESELEKINQFKNNETLNEIIKVSKDNKYLEVSRPVKISESQGCLTCHGNPINSPWKNGKDILGYSMENMKDGDIRAIFTIKSELEPINQEINKAIINIILIGLIVCLISILVSYLILKNPISRIKNVIRDLKDQSEKMGSISATLKGYSKELENSVSEQAISVNETSEAINEITIMINKTNENFNESTIISKKTSQKTDDGQKIISDLVNSMEIIQESNQQLQNISGIIEQIHSKTTVINEIVSKTELLSLNASIESARAGEYGKGFTVVAEEVGNLAKISGKSAEEIQKLIVTSQDEVNNILEISKGRNEEGKKITKIAQETFLSISEDIKILVNLMQQISDATREQETEIKQISHSIDKINQVTQKTQKISLQTSEFSEKISAQSSELGVTSSRIEFLISGNEK